MDEPFARSFGLIQLHSLGIGSKYTREEMERPCRLYGTNGVIEFSTLDWSRVTGADREIYLSDQHEAEHFTTLTSTPAGILLCRLYQVIVRDGRYLAHTFQNARVPIRATDVGQADGVVSWCREFGLARLELVSHLLEHSAVPEYLKRDVLPGLGAVLELIDLLICPTPHETHPFVTRGQFADLLNRTFDYLARRCDIEVLGHGSNPKDWHWASVWASLEPDTPLFASATSTCGAH